MGYGMRDTGFEMRDKRIGCVKEEARDELGDMINVISARSLNILSCCKHLPSCRVNICVEALLSSSNQEDPFRMTYYTFIVM
jgi:hypothetical protein